jgi:hypothetical protein
MVERQEENDMLMENHFKFNGPLANWIFYRSDLSSNLRGATNYYLISINFESIDETLRFHQTGKMIS